MSEPRQIIHTELDGYHGKGRLMSGESEDRYSMIEVDTTSSEPVVEVVAEVETEDPVVVVEDSTNDVITDDIDGADDPDADDKAEGVNEHKPWLKKEKNEVPSWAKKRFKELSSNSRELKEDNAKLKGEIKSLQAAKVDDTPKVLTRNDFPDEEAFLDYRTDLKVNSILEEREKATNKATASKREVDEKAYNLQQADLGNIKQAQDAGELTDYDDVMAQAPDINVRQDIVDFLSQSKAGPHVRYQIANDEALATRINEATPDEQQSIIATIHNTILGELRGQKGGVANVNATSETVAQPQANKRKAPAKGPTKQRGSSSRKDISSLSGEDYIKARNEQKFG